MSGFDQYRHLQELKRVAERESFDTVSSARVGCQVDWTDGDDKLTLTIYGKLTYGDLCAIIEFKAKMDKRSVVNQPR